MCVTDVHKVIVKSHKFSYTAPVHINLFAIFQETT